MKNYGRNNDGVSYREYASLNFLSPLRYARTTSGSTTPIFDELRDQYPEIDFDRRGA